MIIKYFKININIIYIVQMNKEKIKEVLEKLKQNGLKYQIINDGRPLKSDKERLMENLEKINFKPYPNISSDNFNEILNKKEFIENKYEKIKIKEGEDILKSMCSTKDKQFKLLNHQNFIKNYINLNTPYNGILLYHALGSGKSLSAITIAETYRDMVSESQFNR
jgi:hypothetical protein